MQNSHNLVQQAIVKYKEKGLDTTSADIEKNIKELENKGYLEVNEDELKYVAE